MHADSSAGLTDDLFRRESGRLIASLVAQLGTHRLQLAEDVVQEAMVKALQTWPYRGIPDNPGAWLMQAAKNLALDLLRREQRWNEKETSIAAESERWLAAGDSPMPTDDEIADDTLRMLFVCFHPQLSMEAQTALALRTVCGMSAAEIGSSFLTSEAAISKRLVRARQLIRELALPFTVPGVAELPERLEGVLGAIYLLFNEGYKASGGTALVRHDLCHEAMRLAGLLLAHQATRQPRVFALLALMCLNASRLAARTDSEGRLLRLHEQNRAVWDQRLIHQGLQALANASIGDEVSHYHLEAGIAACHCLSPDEARTDWQRILSLYDQLMLVRPSPITALNRSVAVARLHGPKEGLAEISKITDRSTLEAYHLYHAIRGAFAAELGRAAEALTHFRQAGNLATTPSEKDFIQRRIREVSEPG
ncbi:MAG: sigma-70 family RNA polymerase sigma factor [Verrucomicrobiota bacterium]